MLTIKGTNIRLTRGDSAEITLTLTDSAGDAYVPSEGDVIRFSMKKRHSDEEPCLEIGIPTDTLILSIAPADTKSLDFGDYKYDISISFADGREDTFIEYATFTIGEEIHV